MEKSYKSSPDHGPDTQKLGKKLYMKTYGCQMNIYDSERMMDLLKRHGYSLTDTPEDANITILNTCHIREKATEKVFSELGRLKSLKQKKLAAGEEGFLVVAGCVAQAEGTEITRRAPYVDVVVGPQSYHQLPELIERAKRKTGKGHISEELVETNFPVESKFDFLALPEAKGAYSTFLSIQEGCDKFCTYCVVPYTRGAEYSRSVDKIMKEAKHVVDQGVKEITLLGQNVNAYHGIHKNGREIGLGELCLELANIDGLERIRYTTSHPRDMDDLMIRAHAECPKMMPFIHLPVQSGSDKILKEMNRKHTSDAYRQIIDKFRSSCPGIAFSSDFIVGFPGETDDDFEDTMRLVRDINYAQAFSFKYSPRPGTPASVFTTQVDESVKDDRLQRLQKLLFTQQMDFNTSLIGKIIPVLIERRNDQSDQYLGKSPFMQSVVLSSDFDILGTVVQVKITNVGFKMLHGQKI